MNRRYAGSIRKRGEQSWELHFDLGRDPETGRRRQETRTVRGTRKDAERVLRETLVALESGGYVEPAKESVAGFLRRWLTDYAATNTSIRTVQGYAGVVRRYIVPALGAMPLSKLTPRHVQGLYATMLGRGLSPRTVLHAHRVLREALGHAVRWHLVAHNVCNAVDPPRPRRKEMAAWGLDEVRRFLADNDALYAPVFYLGLYTGLRRSELVGLRWPAVDLEAGTLSVTQTLQRISGKGLVVLEPKTGHSRRLVALPSDAVAMLRRHRARQAEHRLRLGDAWQGTDYVFVRPDGRPLDPDEVTHAFARAVKRVGLPPLRFHDLRHTHATLMLKQGVHPKVVSERLGHSSIQITLDTYSHVLPGLQEAAAEQFGRGLAGVSASEATS